MFKQIFNIFKSDSLYEQALLECHEMLDIDLTMFRESIKSLRKSDSAEIKIDIYANPLFRDIPLKLANLISEVAIKNKFIPLIYLVCFFFLLPFIIIILGR